MAKKPWQSREQDRTVSVLDQGIQGLRIGLIAAGIWGFGDMFHRGQGLRRKPVFTTNAGEASGAAAIRYGRVSESAAARSGRHG
jgi:hypothetical protein